MALTGAGGAVSTLNRYDEYGTPAPGNAGRFGYTGQPWMAEAAAWHYLARTYLPQIGRFLQTDPIGYRAGANLYAYVGMDPVNAVDPWGLQEEGPTDLGSVLVTGCPIGTRRDWANRCVGPITEVIINIDPDTTVLDDVIVTGSASGDWLLLPQVPINCRPVPAWQKVLGNVLSVTGYVGDAMTIVGFVTANPVLITAGAAISIGSDVGTAVLHTSQGQYGSAAGDAAGFFVGRLPGGRVLRRVGGSIVDPGRNGAGRLVPNWFGRQRAQDTALSTVQNDATAMTAGAVLPC